MKAAEYIRASFLAMFSATLKASLICMLFGSVASAPAFAHDLGLARIYIDHVEGGQVSVLVQTSSGSAPVELDAGACAAIEAPEQSLMGASPVQQWLLDCQGEGALPLVFSGIADGALVSSRNDRDTDGEYVDSDEGSVTINLATNGPNDDRGRGLLTFTGLGFEHILSGWDHLLFVLMLCLLATGWPLVRLVTAFTVGHSITLALAVLGHVAVAGPAVEACIALSIVFLARQVLVPAQSLMHGFFIVAAFGMLHGLGFAGALVEAGVPQQSVFWALLGFNLGVELGQLVFVAIAMAAFALFDRLRFLPALHNVLAWFAGALGCYWTLARVF